MSTGNCWRQDWPAGEKLKISVQADNWTPECENQVSNFLASILREDFRISGKDNESGKRVFSMETI